MEELKKVYLYKSEEEEKPFIDDNDLQIYMNNFQEKESGVDFKSIYHKYIQDDSYSLEEKIESKKTLHELDGTYASLCEIHDQLVEVYHELIHAQSKD